MYTLTLNIYNSILEHEMSLHHEEADEEQDGLSDWLFLVWSTPHHQESDDISWGWVLVSHNAENEAAPPIEIEGWRLAQTDINSPSPSLIDPAPQNSGSELTSSFLV